MTRDMLRVLLPAIASIALIVAGTLMLDWFIVDFAGARDMAKITFDLREARACSSLGPCAVVPMSMIKGSFYPALAVVTFWAGLVFAVLVLYQAGSRFFRGEANESITRVGHLLGVIAMLTAAGAGYVFGPDFEAGAMMGFGVERGLGPSMMLLGLLAGNVALYFTREGTHDEPPFTKIEPYQPRTRTRDSVIPRAAVVSTRVPLPIHTPPQGQRVVSRAPTVPPVVATPRTKTPPGRAQPLTTPPPLKGKVRFSLVTGDVSAAGIDARREDGGGVLVMWRDVVGFVVRRLPPELEGHPFVDVVSTAGMTLRVLPWSKLTGDQFADGDAEARVRNFVKLVAPRCSEAKIDRATQSFLDDATKKPAQLPNLEMLAKHDQALA